MIFIVNALTKSCKTLVLHGLFMYQSVYASASVSAASLKEKKNLTGLFSTQE